MEDKQKKKAKANSAKKLNRKTSPRHRIASFFKVIWRKDEKISPIIIDQFLENCEKQALIASEEKRMIKNLFKISHLKVIDVMVPRANVVAVKQSSDLNQIKELIIANEHTRIPVYKDNLDEITGFIHSKDLVKFLNSDNKGFKVSNIIRKILFVPQSMRIVDLLLKMRSSRLHIAIVLDEYGGTDGLLTIEDIMEEIVGEIEDEYDIPDDNVYLRIKNIDENVIQFGGRVEIRKVEEALGQKIIPLDDIGDFNTIGGMIMALLKRVPDIDETIRESGFIFRVVDADTRSIKLVEVVKDNFGDD